MKKTILAAAVAMSFTGFAQAADLSIYESVEGVEKNDAGQWVLSNSYEQEEIKADFALLHEESGRTHTTESYTLTDGTVVPKGEYTFEELDSQADTYFGTLESAKNDAKETARISTNAASSNKGNLKTLQQQRTDKLAKVAVLEAETDRFDAAETALRASLDIGELTQDITLSDGSVVTVTKEAGAVGVGAIVTATVKSIGDSAEVATIGLGNDYDFEAIENAEVALIEDAANGLDKQIADNVANQTGLDNTENTDLALYEAAKSAYNTRLVSYQATKLNTALTSASAVVKTAQDKLVDSKIALANATNAKVLNETLDTLSTVSLDKDGNVVKLDAKTGDADKVFADVVEQALPIVDEATLVNAIDTAQTAVKTAQGLVNAKVAQIGAKQAEIDAVLKATPLADVTALNSELDGLNGELTSLENSLDNHQGEVLAKQKIYSDEKDILNEKLAQNADAVARSAENKANWAAKGVVANNKAIVKTAAFANENREKIVGNTAAIKVNSDRLDGHDVQLSNHNDRITSNEANIETLEMNFADLSADFYEFKSVASKGIAGVAAMSQIDSVYAEVGQVFVGAGVGSFNGEGAVAIGLGYRATEALSVRAAGSFASGDAEPVIAAGMTYTFK